MRSPPPHVHARIGPFELQEKIGAGGQGEVWRGHHRPSQRPVAIKLIRATPRDRDGHTLQREVQATACLTHPHIVRLIDHGRLEADTVGAPAGTTYLVMDWIHGRPIHRDDLATWQPFKKFLITILDGLACAHARGVVHRDLKPSNVLMSWRDNRWLPKLVDFGLATLSHTRTTTRLRAGTPGFAAPEQITSTPGWRQGPWTDLYGLGALCYALFTGHPAHTTPTRSTREVLAAHVAHGIPQPPLPFALPDGFASWFAQLTSPHPHARFEFAADAAWALEQLPPPETPSPHHASYDPPPLANDALTLNSLLELSPSISATTAPAPVATAQRETRLFPTQWQSTMPRVPQWIQGTGLSLFDLREWPVIGRDDARATLWALLQRVHGGACLGVIMDGISGVGKSRLARWLCERDPRARCRNSHSTSQ